MRQSLDRIAELLEGSKQIVDHMEADASNESKIQEIREKLKQQNAIIANLWSQQEDEINRHSIASLQQKLTETEQIIGNLEDDILRDYNRQTENTTQRFESIPIAEQMNDLEAYHGKIDHKSTEKLKQNLSKINAELQEISNKTEQAALEGNQLH